jgi:prepilin-type N-terminal cleavage/methylation domain-containing protein
MDGRRIAKRHAGRARISRADVVRAWRDETGVTLIEVVIAAVILGVLASAVLSILLQTQVVEVGNRGRVAAANLAAREIDMTRDEFARSLTAPVEIADLGTVTNLHPLDDGTMTVDGVPYTVVRSAQWNVTPTGHTACEGGTLVSQPTLNVSVSVTWPHMGTIQPVVSTATLAPVKGNGVQSTSSFVAVSVTDSLGAPNSGRAVSVVSASEVRTGTTDESGCAVVEVNPATGAGTPYTVSLGDPGYVDISGNPNPSKVTGNVAQGKLNNGVRFTYDQAGQVKLTLVDPSGGSLSDSDVAGSQVTLVAGESTGTRSRTSYTLTHVVTTITGLWPTDYGAYFGTAVPVYVTQQLVPGGSIDLTVPFELATTSFTGWPATTTSVIAVPSATGTTCTTAGARNFSPSATVDLMPGNWDFFAVGPAFSCSPGPKAEPLFSGSNDAVAWGTTTLQMQSVPVGNALWAVERGRAGASLSTCPTSAQASTAQNIDASRMAPFALPAGDWYLYLTNGAAAGGTCVAFPATINPTTVAYGVANLQTWPPPSPVVVTIKSVPSYGSGQYATIVATSVNSASCTATVFTTAGTQISFGTGSTVTTTLAQGTWYIYSWDKRTSGAGSPRCKLGGTVIAGPNSPLSLTFNSTSPGTVGP